jgi:hypothetical protein
VASEVVRFRASKALLARLDALAKAHAGNRSLAIKSVLMEASREADGLPPVCSREELLALLSEAARGGSVPACKTLLDELRRDEAPSARSNAFSEELGQRAGKVGKVTELRARRRP